MLKNNEVVAANSQNEYEIKFEFKETGINQNIDQNKTYKSNIKVTAKSVN